MFCYYLTSYAHTTVQRGHLFSVMFSICALAKPAGNMYQTLCAGCDNLSSSFAPKICDIWYELAWILVRKWVCLLTTSSSACPTCPIEILNLRVILTMNSLSGHYDTMNWHLKVCSGSRHRDWSLLERARARYDAKCASMRTHLHAKLSLISELANLVIRVTLPLCAKICYQQLESIG